ncbi:TIGR03571 family LLM class oxidoreductase [Gluconobacter sp. R71646]|uniref:TIGR03571 family LLM class oxidoreductase n=1 Tax=Gluconobacter potus TaxID=2724927 RepID=A0ABR9YP01_9PROT|nr:MULTISPECIES: TIGR03571 family LLM class oxidoreductase [Gluconobacter]MBF0865374.1 TIGR03571 family LLM class oxidoreductase [Gluconobacter sp. R71656]MBF0868861.1 TIGR03571 family LLM class oxidoreductase [Gluconobacter sp. R75628]MBF0874863.1 TIGR03571 family LLM class oxidoreductase [Gluconobacter sp. R75629]MBF0883521.1 TIGR03571 family LLM class oxidoreductase [Gluconobacter potus]GFE97881.1 monooxygenase [Gluconobacter sp. Gdi]
MNALDKLCRNCLTIGIELPIDNDWARSSPTEARGVADISRQGYLVKLAEEGNFAAVWQRDVPVFDPIHFGDAGSIFDPFVNYGYLSAITSRIVIGTAGVVLPLRSAIDVAKAAASADVLSGGRIVLGLASGDRKLEYPLYAVNYDERGAIYRRSFVALEKLWRSGDMESMEQGAVILPRSIQPLIPRVVIGGAQQSTSWIARHADAWFVYPGPIEHLAKKVSDWEHERQLIGRSTRGVITALHLDLDRDPDCPLQPFRFGGRMGRNTLMDYLKIMNEVKLSHVAILLRPSQRPPDEVIYELSQYVIPKFHIDVSE